MSTLSATAAKDRHSSGKTASQPDSGCYSTTPFERSVELIRADKQADEFVTVDKDPEWKGLPSPADWTDKNPFGSFLALTLLLQHREAILKVYKHLLRDFKDQIVSKKISFRRVWTTTTFAFILIN